MGAAASAGVGAVGAEGPGGESGSVTPDCYFCHMCRHSFEFLPGPQSDGRDSQAPDICTACGSDAVEMVRRGGRGGSMMPATDTLHQLVMASDGAISGPELLMNMLAFSGHGLFGPDPEERAMQESLEAEGKTRPTPEEVREQLPERPLGMSVLEREPDCVICGEEFALGGGATSLPCGHHFHKKCIMPWLEKHTSCPVCRFEIVDDEGCLSPPPKRRPAGGSGTPEPKRLSSLEPEPEPELQPAAALGSARAADEEPTSEDQVEASSARQSRLGQLNAQQEPS